MTQLHILLAFGAALTLVALALLTIRALNAAVKLALIVAVCIGLAVVGIIALRAVTIPTLAHVDVDLAAPTLPLPQVAPGASDVVNRAPSAAATITIFLLVVITGMVLATVGTVVGWHWWKQRQKRQRLEAMALLYSAMNSDGAPPALPRQTARPQPGQPNIYVVGGQYPQPQPEPLPGWQEVPQ